MGVHRHHTVQHRIDALFTSGLSPAKRAELFAEVEGCVRCGGYYRRHQMLEDALSGTVEGVSPFMRERILEAALAATPIHATRARRILWGRWSPMGAALAAAAMVMFLLWPLGSPSSSRTALPENAGLAPVHVLAAKGVPASATADIGIRVFQVARRGDRVEEKDAVALNDILTFTYTYAKPHDGYLAIFGVQETGEVRWYYPDYGGEKSIRIKGDRVDEPLGDGIDLRVNHTPGWLRIVAVFSDKPVSAEAVESGVDRLRVRGDGAELSNAFPFENFGATSLQYSVIMEIEGER